uniref:WGS project CAEQ00000000 data, annotated contig 405 n=1 Tax=Trypanosoma congolense (strain IL3000) TaxID=1068625 RepID=F9WFM9_TRYCI|nr:unnamed protein product [Trypanosoma congolense IL3000]
MQMPIRSEVTSRYKWKEAPSLSPTAGRSGRHLPESKSKAVERKSDVVRRQSITVAIHPSRTTITAIPNRTSASSEVLTSRSRAAATPYRGSHLEQRVRSVLSPVEVSPLGSTHSSPRLRRTSSMQLPTSGRCTSVRRPISSRRRSIPGPMPTRPTIPLPTASSEAPATHPPERATCSSSAPAEPTPQDRPREDVKHNSVPFSISGHYSRAVVVNASASVWAANEETGSIDIFSGVSGDFSGHIAPRQLSKPPGMLLQNCNFSMPTALKASTHHVWVGYDDGTVVVYDHLCISVVTSGCFHSTPVVSFCTMAGDITVSGSSDMTLVRWDKEEKNFEAITRIVGVPEPQQALTCIASFGEKIVLCGTTTGNVVAVDCAVGMQAAMLRKHESRVNALVVMDNLLFSAAEESCVNVWSLRNENSSAGTAFQSCCQLLRSISVRMTVRDLAPHHGSRSLWVAYLDGTIERWSANPDDGFGSEQVIRDGVVEMDGSQQRLEVLSLHCMGTAETMRVLALGSNGISKVWCGHRNQVEESLRESIKSLNDIISNDTAEAAAWEAKAQKLRQKELKRKGKYTALLGNIFERQLLFSYYVRWRTRVSRNIARKRQYKDLCVGLEGRHRFLLTRRYFTMWCGLHEREQRHKQQKVLSDLLQKTSLQIWVKKLLCKWQSCACERRMTRHRGRVAEALEKVCNALLLEKFYIRWRHHERKGQTPLSREKLDMLESKARERVQRHVFEEWRLVQASPGSKGARALPKPSTSNGAKIAEVYHKVVMERHRRRIYDMWNHLATRRRTMLLLTSVAKSKELQLNRETMYRVYMVWQLFVQKRRLIVMSKEVQQVEKQLRHAEETNADIFDRLQLQKRLDQLRRQHDSEARQLQEELARAQELIMNRDSVRQCVGQPECKNSAEDDEVSPSGMFVTPSRSSPQAFFSPVVLRKMPILEAMEYVMTRLKGIALNLYTDMGLFRQIRDRLKCGSTPAAIFLEGFNEVKRLVVSLSKKRSTASWRSGERWALTTESFENVRNLPCTSVVQGIKSMVLAYDMLNTSDLENLAATREEIVENIDLLFNLWKACYAARKPVLPVNNRVSVR